MNQTTKLSRDERKSAVENVNLDPAHIQKLLREKGVTLHAYKTGTRYLCRIVNTDGKLVSLSSGGTLPHAVSIALLLMTDIETN